MKKAFFLRFGHQFLMLIGYNGIHFHLYAQKFFISLVPAQVKERAPYDHKQLEITHLILARIETNLGTLHPLAKVDV